MTRLWRGRPDADRARSALVACAAAGSLLLVSGCGAATTLERTAADVSVTSSASASPLPPADFKAVLKGTTAVLSWTPSRSTGLTGYTIFVDNGPPASVPGSVTQYRAEGLAPTMSHLVQVVAVAGQEQSAPVSLTVEVPATAVEGQAGSDPFARPTPSASATPSPAQPTAAPQPVPTTATPTPTPSTTSQTVSTAEACEVAVTAFHGDDASLAGVIKGDNDAARTGHTLGSEIARLEQVADRTTQPMKRLIYAYTKVTREARLSLLNGDDLARTFDSGAFYAAGNAIKNYCATQADPLG
jgi:hypothetical protein